MNSNNRNVCIAAWVASAVAAFVLKDPQVMLVPLCVTIVLAMR